LLLPRRFKAILVDTATCLMGGGPLAGVNYLGRSTTTILAGGGGEALLSS